MLLNFLKNISIGPKWDVTELKLLWPVNMTSHSLKIILSPETSSELFTDSWLWYKVEWYCCSVIYLCDLNNIDFCNKWIGLHVCLWELE